MSALEQEIIEKFRRLQPTAKRRVRALIDQEVISETDEATPAEFDYAVWSHDVESLREQIHADQGNRESAVDVVGILRAIRDGDDEWS